MFNLFRNIWYTSSRFSKSKGCLWNSSLQDLENHIKYYCLYTEIICPNKDCGQYFERKNLENHFALNCEHNWIFCIFKENGCNDKILKKKLIEHLNQKHLKDAIDLFEDLKNLNTIKKENTKLKKKIDSFNEENLDPQSKKKKNSFSSLYLNKISEIGENIFGAQNYINSNRSDKSFSKQYKQSKSFIEISSEKKNFIEKKIMK